MAFLFKKEGRFYIAAKSDGRWRRQSTGFTREDQAKKVLRRVENRLAEGLPPFDEAQKHTSQTFRQFAKKYLDWKEANGKNVKTTTRQSHRNRFRPLLTTTLPTAIRSCPIPPSIYTSLSVNRMGTKVLRTSHSPPNSRPETRCPPA